MKQISQVQHYDVLEYKFFAHAISDYEAYHWMRCHKHNEQTALRVILKWVNERKTLNAVFGKGK